MPRKIIRHTVDASRRPRRRTRQAASHMSISHLVGEDGQEYMVLRTMYMTPALDVALKSIAARQGKSKNQLMREVLASAVQNEMEAIV